MSFLDEKSGHESYHSRFSQQIWDTGAQSVTSLGSGSIFLEDWVADGNENIFHNVWSKQRYTTTIKERMTTYNAEQHGGLCRRWNESLA
jgi:hypothetical protein